MYTALPRVVGWPPSGSPLPSCSIFRLTEELLDAAVLFASSFSISSRSTGQSTTKCPSWPHLKHFRFRNLPSLPGTNFFSPFLRAIFRPTDDCFSSPFPRLLVWSKRPFDSPPSLV